MTATVYSGIYLHRRSKTKLLHFYKKYKKQYLNYKVIYYLFHTFLMKSIFIILYKFKLITVFFLLFYKLKLFLDIYIFTIKGNDKHFCSFPDSSFEKKYTFLKCNEHYKYKNIFYSLFLMFFYNTSISFDKYNIVITYFNIYK